jgi:DNA replication protein DnaC
MELISLLERMKMEHLLAQLDGVCEQAAKGDDKGFLTQALEAEWRGRHQRGVESRLKLARFPWLKSLEPFDFDFQPSIDRKMLRELAGLSFVERTENVVLLGPPARRRKNPIWPSPSASRRWRPVTRCSSSPWKR